MMGQWTSTKLGELCARVASGGTPLRSVSEYYDNGTIPWLKTGEVKKGIIYDTEERITESGLENSSAKLIPANSVIVAMYGDGDTAGNVAINKIPLTTNQACCNFTLDAERAHYRYIYYYLKGSYSNLINLKLGGSQQNLNAQSLKTFPISHPDVPAQEKIAAILSAYDDLIENNRRRIALLEKMAEEIYREWFVRMRFPGHEQAKFEKGVPVGWSKKKLPEVAKITYGFPFQGDRFNTVGNGKPIIRIRNIQEASSQDFTDEVVDDKYVVKKGDLLVGMDGGFHMNHWQGDDAYLVQRTCRIKAIDPLLEGYLAHALRAPIKHYESILMGATVGHLGAMHLNSIDILMPPKPFLEKLEMLNQLLKQKIAFSSQSSKLAVTRNELLPRLISGKLPVEKLDIHFPPSMEELAHEI